VEFYDLSLHVKQRRKAALGPRDLTCCPSYDSLGVVRFNDDMRFYSTVSVSNELF